MLAVGWCLGLHEGLGGQRGREALQEPMTDVDYASECEMALEPESGLEVYPEWGKSA